LKRCSERMMVRRSSHDVIGESDFGCAIAELRFGVRLMRVPHHEKYKHDYASNTVPSIDLSKCSRFGQRLSSDILPAVKG
jgi:hypothetical protein